MVRGARVMPVALRSERAAQAAFLRGDVLRQAVRPRNGGARLFSAARPRRAAHMIHGLMARFASRSKIAARRHPLLRSGRLRGAGPARLPPLVAMKAAMGAADPIKEHHNDR